VGSEFPIVVRISADEFLPDGITIQESPEIARMLEKVGAHCIDISCGTYLNQHKVSDVMRMDEGWKRPIWKAITEAVDIPTIAAGGNRNPEFCERLIAEGDVAFVGLARQMQADPYWPQKTAQGRIQDINRCTSCLRCLYGLDGKPPVVRQCMVNAMWGREKDFVVSFRTSSKKNVIVIGGGPAGMETARIASFKGHQVTLYEKGPEIGGQLLLAAVLPGKSKMLWLRDFLAGQIKKQGVTIRPNTTVDTDALRKINPDVVVVATGATPFVPNIPGIKSTHCVTAWDVLAGTSQLSGIHVVVLGGGTVGCEIAEYLAKSGKRVTIIEMLPKLAHEMEPLNRRALLDELKTLKVTALVEKRAVEITNNGVVTLDEASGEQDLLTCEHVVLALGAVSNQGLFQDIEGAYHERFMIGDCFKPRTALEAVRDGFFMGHRI
jgi:thioredoxin reductase